MTYRPGAAIGNAMGDLLTKTLVRSGSVEVCDVFLYNAAELFEMQNEHVIQALSAQAANEALAK